MKEECESVDIRVKSFGIIYESCVSVLDIGFARRNMNYNTLSPEQNVCFD